MHRFWGTGRSVQVPTHCRTGDTVIRALIAAGLLLQSAWGIVALPQPASAAPASITWTEQADFEANSSTTGDPTTRVQVDTVTSPGDVKLSGGIVGIGSGSWHVLGIRADGTVIAVGGEEFIGLDHSETLLWTDIVEVAGGFDHTVGLKDDGTAVMTESAAVPMDVSDWTTIAAIDAGWGFTSGLRSDGSVVTTGPAEGATLDTTGWSGITQIAAGTLHVLGLRSDGTVVATGRYYDWNGHMPETAAWTDIAAVAGGSSHSVGLKSDGTVVAVGTNEYGQCDVGGWTGIVAIAAGGYHTLGITADGTVLAAGDNFYDGTAVSGWTDITAIATGYAHTIGLRADGSVVATGLDEVVGDVAEAFASSVPDGSIGMAPGAVGLRADVGAGSTPVSLAADFDALSAGEAVKFGVRLSDDGTTWTEVVGSDGDAVDWTSGTGTYLGQAYGDAAPRTDLSQLPSARYIDIVVLLEGASGTSPVLHSVTLSYETGQAETYTVSFESNGGTAVPPQTVDEGGLVTEPVPDPTKEHYTFAGWYQDVALTVPWDFANDTVASDMTLYAAWDIDTYTVTFNSNGGTAVPDQLVPGGGLVTEPMPPTREGYAFSGWFADAGLTDPWDFDEDVVTGDMTLYAKWIHLPVTFVRHDGIDRYETAMLAAIRNFPVGTKVAVVATGERFPDALAASGLAGIVDAPILLTRINALSPACDYALRALGVEKVYILGDTKAVSAGIETEFRKRYLVTRLGGPDRYYTARDIADEAMRLGGSNTEAFLAQGVNFPDALAVSSIATQEHITVLLTRPGDLHSEARAVIAGAGIKKVYIAGDTKAISATVATQVTQAGASVIRWAGPNRYDTAGAIVNGALATWGLKVAKIGIATGSNWPDALTGGAAMGRQDGLLLLSRPDLLSAYIESLILTHKATITEVEFYGSTKSLSQAVENRVRYLLQ